MRSQNSQIHERQSRTEVARGRDEKGIGSRLMGTESQFSKMEVVLEMEGGDSCNSVKYLNA